MKAQSSEARVATRSQSPPCSDGHPLYQRYGCTIVLCTATQPALERRDDFAIGIENVRHIIPDAGPLFQALKRVQVKRLQGKLNDDELAQRLTHERAVLCIVNTRPHASRLYDRLVEVSPEEECFHLSTWTCGAHRREVLKTIRERLDRKLLCRVVSTQLVEAGVDVDFPTVYRAEAGFDSIAQAAGRCNREGLLPVGMTNVFEGEARPLVGAMRSTADIARELQSRHSDPLLPESVEAYFKRFYWSRKGDWDKHKVMETMDFDRQRERARCCRSDLLEA
jgi:CRISPR-associated endonuclease/helicase Cas3